MKKLIFTLGVMLLICVCAVATTIEIETPPLKYVINGEVVKMPEGESGFLYNDRTYVPIRFIAEALNKDVSWNDDTNTITISDKQPDCYELTDGVLYKNGIRYDIKADGEVEYKKLYDNKLVYYVSRHTFDDIVYDVYLCDFNTMLTEKIDVTTDFVGDIKRPVADFIFNFLVFRDNYPICVINLKTGDIDYISGGHQACMIWDNETIYYSNVSDEGIYKEVIGETPELLADIDIIGAWMLHYNDKLYCYDVHEDKGAVIDLITKRVISKELTQTEKNSVVLREMLHIVEGYNRGYEYEPYFTDRKAVANLEYECMSGEDIVLKSNVSIDEKQYPKSVFIENGCGKLELLMEYIGDNKVKIKLDLLRTEDKEKITEIILKQIG